LEGGLNQYLMSELTPNQIQLVVETKKKKEKYSLFPLFGQIKI
jgi:hypothetical protein